MATKTDNGTLLMGTASIDITPPLEVGLLTSSVEGRWSPFRSVRMPLKARVVVLKSETGHLALVSLDLLGLTSTAVGGWNAFKHALSDTIPPERIIITCTHTHNAPESVALTNLYQKDSFRVWLEELQNKIAQSIQKALLNIRRIAIAIGSTDLQNYSLQRRIPTKSGMVISDSLQPISQELLKRGPVDRRIHAMWFSSGDNSLITTLVHAVCHPVHEMCLPHISPDFPGELCAALDTYYGKGMSLFLNGAAGDINPTTVGCGAEYARKYALAIAEAVGKASYKKHIIETHPFIFSHREVVLQSRSFNNMPDQQECIARLRGIRIGSMAIIFLPGEPFVETALEIERISPFKHTLIVAYAENSVGYIPPEHSFKEGGYEIGPGKWSFLQPGADLIIRQNAVEILNELKAG